MSDNERVVAAIVCAWRAHQDDFNPAIAARHVERAIAAEREACAKIADEMANDPHGSNPSCSTAELIASDIRARGREKA